MSRPLVWFFVAACLGPVLLTCGPSVPSPESTLPPLAVADPFAGLAPMAETDAAQAFTFRQGPKPPPRTGETLALPFPPPAAPGPAKPVAHGPLRVLRTQPAGQTDLVGAVVVTFNQPMVPLASLQDLAMQSAPMSLSPRPPGRFRWLGTTTLAFEPEGRMPMGTLYRATIPAGVAAQSGQRLETAVSWEFSTPRPQLAGVLPSRHSTQVEPDTALAFQFNQRVAAKDLQNKLKLNNLSSADFMLVDPKDWAGLPHLGETLASWDPERTVVVQPIRPLPLATRFDVQIQDGLRGEGPLGTTATLHHSFATYGPLRIQGIRCGDEEHCGPESGFVVSFTNPLITTEPSKYVKVSPAPDDLEVEASYRSLYIRGSFTPRASITVEVLPGLRDTHDQTLAQGQTATLKTGDLIPLLAFPVEGHAVMELHGPRQVPVQVQGVTTARLRLVRVAREQIREVIDKAERSWDAEGKKDPLKGIKGLVATRTQKTGVTQNGRGRLGLSTDLGLGPNGAGVLYLELRSEELRRRNKWANIFRGLVVSVTDIGLLARYDHDRIVVLLTSLRSGQPIPGASLELRDRDGRVIATGTAGPDGMAELPGRRSLKGMPPYTLWASSGKDSTFVFLEGTGAAGQVASSYHGWSYPPSPKQFQMFVYSDRNPYRPGERVQLSGILRVSDMSPTGGLEAATGARSVKVVVTSPRGRKVLEKDGVPVSVGGSFSLEVELPEDADLGKHHVFVSSSEGSGVGTFDVEAYRAPEFEVKVQTGGGPFFLGDTLAASVGADYLFGAPMAGAEVKWTLRRSGTHYAPPGNEGFQFGESLPIWFNWQYQYSRSMGRYAHGFDQVGAAGAIVSHGAGRLDNTGRLAVKVPLRPEGEDDPKAEGTPKTKAPAGEEPAHAPTAFTLEAEVLDQNRQSIANREVLTAHPSSLYLGLRPEKSMVKAGEALSVSAVAVSLDGKRLSGQALTLRALEVKNTMTPVREGGRWEQRWETQLVEVARCQVRSSLEPTACALTLPRPGAYLIRTEQKDSQGRLARTTAQVYAHGPGVVPWRLENQSRLELVADRETYRPGDTARLLVKSPLGQASGFLTVSRGGMASVRLIRVQGNAEVLEVPIPDNSMPGVYVGVALARGRIKDLSLGDAADDLGRPTFAHGELRLPVSLDERRVTVEVLPAQSTVRPSGKVQLTLKTLDSNGKPVPSELAVMAVDEGVLALLGTKTPDPLAFFWTQRPPNTGLQDTRNTLLKQEIDLKKILAKPGYRDNGENGGEHPVAGNGGRNGKRVFKMASLSVGDGLDDLVNVQRASRSEPMADAASRSPAQPIRSRSVFATTAFFRAGVLTDQRGEARLEVTMPDNLTTFRFMAVALDQSRPDRFGHGESQVKVRKPLLLRPSLPRFLSIGDRFEAAVMVHNETDAEGLVDVLVRGRNVKALSESRKRVRLAAHGAAEVRFPMEPQSPGPARLQFAAVLGSETDAVEQQVPVLLPATTEAFATYGLTDGSLVQPVVPPADALPGYGGLEVSLSSTALTGLEDAVTYLHSYPYECTEQTASRILPIFALKEILPAFHIATLKDQATQQRLAREGVKKILQNQNYDGGFVMWTGQDPSWPHLTAYALFTLLRARESGLDVPQDRLDRASRYLKHILNYPRKEFGDQYAYTTQVMSVWALSDLKVYERAHITRLFGLRDKLPLFARAMLMQAAFRADGLSAEVKELLRDLQNQAVETAGAAHFAEVKTESLRLLMHSEERTDAIALYALLETSPEDALMAKLVRGLLQARVHGRWSTTQANAYALTALARYYRQVERVVPDFLARLWLGEEGFLGESAFKGRQMRVVQQTVPLDALQAAGKKADLVLEKNGEGKLYYRMGLRYAPRSLRLAAEEQGFCVTRTYEPIEGQTDTVIRSSDGTIVVKAGATVRVRLTVVVPDQRYYVAVMDPLPAGLEGVNLKLRTSASSRLGNELKGRISDVYSWYALFAFDHREMRDESVVLFSDRLPAGVYEYTYLAQATTPGRFVAAPTRAEEMYQPETFGRTATDIVEVR